jgi:hypothetical protein
MSTPTIANPVILKNVAVLTTTGSENLDLTLAQTSSGSLIISAGSVIPTSISQVSTNDFTWPRDIIVGRNILFNTQPLEFIPSADSVTAVQFKSLSLTPPVLNIDTIDGSVGINTAAPNRSLEVIGNASVSTDFLASIVECQTNLRVQSPYPYAAIVAQSNQIGQIWCASDTKALLFNNGSDWQTIPTYGPVTITGTGTVTPDASAGSEFTTTVTGALTLDGPINPSDGQQIIFRLLQDGTGHTVTFASGSGNFSFGATVPSFTASAANLTDYVYCIYNATQTKWNVIYISKGF